MAEEKRMDVTEEQVIQTLRDVVAERPEYVYQRPEHMSDPETEGVHDCYYVHTAEDGGALLPGCVAGHVFLRLGVDLPELRTFEGNSAGYLLRELLRIDEDSAAGLMLASAQEHQDGGESWADALRAAELFAAELESGE